jgi:hypothetical protein
MLRMSQFDHPLATHALQQQHKGKPMRRIQSIKQRSLSRNTMIVLAAVMLTAAAATDALAAGRGGGGGGGARGGHMSRGVGGPWLNNVPSLPAPIFNQSTPYTVPQLRETPVSPASPGSVFGNG